MTSDGNNRRGPRMEWAAEERDDVLTRHQPIDQQPEPRPSMAVPMMSLLISMLALGLAVWALAVPPDPLITAPPIPGATISPSGDRVARLENDMQRALLHLVTMEERLKKLQARIDATGKPEDWPGREQPPTPAAAQPEAAPETTETKAEPTTAATPPAAQAPAAATPGHAVATPTPPAETKAKPEAKPAAPGQEPVKPTAKPTAKQLHEVRTGDNLYSVARQHGVSVEDLRRWNNLDKESVIKVGQKLIIQQ